MKTSTPLRVLVSMLMLLALSSRPLTAQAQVDASSAQHDKAAIAIAANRQLPVDIRGAAITDLGAWSKFYEEQAHQLQGEIVQVLLDCMDRKKETNNWLRTSAIKTLGMNFHVPTYDGSTPSRVPPQVWARLTYMLSPLNEPDPAVRTSVAYALESMQPTEKLVISALIASLDGEQEPYADARRHAAAALAVLTPRIQDPAIFDALLRSSDPANERDRFVRCQAVIGLGWSERADPSCMAALSQALHYNPYSYEYKSHGESSPIVRSAAARALNNIGNLQGVYILESALKSEKVESVRQEIENAIKRLNALR